MGNNSGWCVGDNCYIVDDPNCPFDDYTPTDTRPPSTDPALGLSPEEGGWRLASEDGPHWRIGDGPWHSGQWGTG